MSTKNLPLKMIPFGTVYLIDRELSPAEQRRDLENIKGLGFNTVVLWPVMSRWEAERPGGVAFGAVDYVMDCCAELGLKAILELQGQTMSDQEAPECAKLPKGSPNHHHRDNNLNDPSYQELTREYMQQVVAHFKDHPALLAFDVYNEVGNCSSDPYTVREFTRFLEQQYNGDIQALNTAWSTYFSSFRAIETMPPHYDAWDWASIIGQRDWLRFRSHNYCQRTREWVAAVHEIAPDAIAFGDTLGCDTMHSRSGDYYGVCDWPFAEEVDILGLSCYANMIGKEWWKCDAWRWSHFWRSSLSAAAGKQTIISELMTQNRSLFPAEGSSMEDQIRLWSFHALFNGIQGLIYWKYRPFRKSRQVAGRGLTDFDAKPNHFAEQAAEAACFAEQHADLLANARPDHAGCAILHDANNQNVLDILHPQFPDFYTDAQSGVFRGFWDAGISPAFLTVEQILPAVPDDIRVLAVPCDVVLSQAAADALKAFVQRGGFLYTESRFALLNEEATLWNRVPGGGLAEYLGVEEIDFAARFNDVLPLTESELRLENDYFQTLKLREGVEVVARTAGGTPALVGHQIGAGYYMHASLLLGSRIHQGEPGARELFAQVIEQAKSFANPALLVVDKDPLVDVSVLLDDAGEPVLLGLCNYHNRPATVRLQGRIASRLLQAYAGADLSSESDSTQVTLPARRPVAIAMSNKEG